MLFYIACVLFIVLLLLFIMFIPTDASFEINFKMLIIISAFRACLEKGGILSLSLRNIKGLSMDVSVLKTGRERGSNGTRIPISRQPRLAYS